MLKLDLGCGEHCEEGFLPIDRRLGKEVYPLTYPDNSVDEIKASHVLEHFGHAEANIAFRDWVRVLKPGGRIRVAVPDFAYIAKGYLEGKREPFAHYLFGGQTDANDFHKTVFDEDRLSELMTSCGLSGIKRWVSSNGDCAGLACSLNLEGVKGMAAPVRALPRIAAVMSMPRLAFSDNMFCAIGVVTELRLPLERITGVFWGQCLERVMEKNLEGADYVLTIDYDSAFTADDVRKLAAMMEDNPQVDALCPLQVKREEDTCILGVTKPDGSPFPDGYEVTINDLAGDLTRLAWGHFGLTLIRTARLKDFPHPWFLSVPNKEGRWGEGRHDDDTFFWKKWIESGRTLYLASRLAIGHMQLMVSWPDKQGNPIFQYPTKFNAGKRPAEVWQ